MNIEEKIKLLLENIRPFLNMDGGDIEFIKYEENILYIKLIGNCSHCLMQDDTLNNGIKKMFKDEIPEIEDIINVDL